MCVRKKKSFEKWITDDLIWDAKSCFRMWVLLAEKYAEESAEALESGRHLLSYKRQKPSAKITHNVRQKHE